MVVACPPPLCVALLHCAPRSAVLLCGADGGRTASSIIPAVDAALIARVKSEIWRTSGPEAAAGMVEEQTAAMASTLQRLVRVIDAQDKSPEAADLMLSQETLDRAIAPQLPLLLLRGFPSLMREALAEVRLAFDCCVAWSRQAQRDACGGVSTAASTAAGTAANLHPVVTL